MAKKITVLITPAGSGMAVVAIKAVKQDPDIKIVAADMNPLASGLHLVHKGYLMPPISDPSFFSKIDSIIKKEKVNVVIPCLDTFLLPFAKRRAFEEKDVKVVVSPKETIEVCRDKWQTYTLLRKSIPMPRSTIDFNDLEETCKYIGFPAILKPRSGSGSKNVYLIRDENDLVFYLKKLDGPMLQQYIDGGEYTVDMLVNKDGKSLVIAPRKRIETKAGISVKGVIELNPALIQIGRKICEELQLFGPVNFQAVVDKKDKTPKVTEINPRISGGMSLTISAGFNIPLFSIYLAMGKSFDIPSFPKRTIHMTRYYEEVIIINEDLEKNFKTSERN